MGTETLIVPASSAGAIEQAAQVLRRGGLVAFPTDTVYGVAAMPFDSRAVEHLYTAKERPFQKAIPLLLGSSEELDAVVESVNSLARALVGRYWPGPLTLVLQRRPTVPDIVTAGGSSVAVRMPDHPVALALLHALGGVLAASSANRSGSPSPTLVREVMDQLGGRVDLILDGGACPGGLASTVLDLNVCPPLVLRRGPIAHAELHSFWLSVASEPRERFSAQPAELLDLPRGALRIAIGSDHAGYALKEEVARWLANRGHAVFDLGTASADVRVHYPDYGRAVAQAVSQGEADFGIAICGTGVGMSIAANRVRSVRAALCTDTYMARMSRQHNDANVLCLGQRVVGVGLALDIVAAWLGATFEGGRHAQRVEKCDADPAVVAGSTASAPEIAS